MEKKLTVILTKKQLQAMMYYFKKHNQQSIAEEFNITQSAISSIRVIGVWAMVRRLHVGSSATGSKS
jgi:DNA-directed RNA polymerase specialized sigma subunit